MMQVLWKGASNPNQSRTSRLSHQRLANRALFPLPNSPAEEFKIQSPLEPELEAQNASNAPTQADLSGAVEVEVEQEEATETRRSTRSWKPTSRALERFTASLTHLVQEPLAEPEHVVLLASEILTPDEVAQMTPRNEQEANDSKFCKDWEEARELEYAAHRRNQTFGPAVDLPNGFKAIPCDLIYKIKTDPTGNIDRFKVRVIVKGYKMRAGFDYNETFAPVVRFSSIPFLLAVASESKKSGYRFCVPFI